MNLMGQGQDIFCLFLLLDDYMHEDPAEGLRAQPLAKKLKEAVGILTRVIGQTERREMQYGHKVFLTVNATISGTKLTLVELKILCAPNSEAA